MRRYSHVAIAAFSLVELSIVLVILGLLTGGILTGQSLIHASEIRSITTEMQRNSTAMQTFRDKYFGLPGDINNATQIWGAADAVLANCITTSTGDMRTCDGDADGYIYNTTIANGYEAYRVWQQLANAGMMEGQYTGIAGSGASPGSNAPMSKSGSQNVWTVVQPLWGNSSYTATGNGNFFAGEYLHSMFLMRVGQLAATADSFALRPEDAWNIDTKMDDGKPAAGSVRSYRGAAATPCTSRAAQAADTTLDPAATYNLTDTSRDCPLIFAKAF